MAPKKKVVRNSYYFFMIEFKEREEAKGRSFPNGLRDVAIAADSQWKSLTPDQKKPYESMAKQWKMEQRQSADKYTTLGTRFQTVDEKARREEEEFNIMYQAIENDIAALQTKEALIDKVFYLVHVNYYCQLEGMCGASDVFIPAEIAIVEFNLRCGVINEYHTFVRASIPSGYAYTARSHSEETHEIPVDYKEGERNHLKILHDIKSFLMQGQKTRVLPPLYTMRDERNLNTSFEAVKSTLKNLCEASVAEEDQDIFRVFQVGKLSYELEKASQSYDPTAINKPIQTLCENFLEMETFSYSPGFACKFHEGIDRAVYCSLSAVKGWAYGICDHCCEYLNITLIPGKHCVQQSGNMLGDNAKNREQWRGKCDRKERPEYRGSEQPRSKATEYANNTREENKGSGDSWGAGKRSQFDDDDDGDDDENDNEVSGTQSGFAAYVANVQSIVDGPSNRSCWATVARNASDEDPASRFTDDEFPAIGQLSMSEPRNRNPASSNPPTGGLLSMRNFPAIGRGRGGLGRGGLGRGRGQL